MCVYALSTHVCALTWGRAWGTVRHGARQILELMPEGVAEAQRALSQMEREIQSLVEDKEKEERERQLQEQRQRQQQEVRRSLSLATRTYCSSVIITPRATVTAQTKPCNLSASLSIGR